MSDPAGLESTRDANEVSIIVVTSVAHMICHMGELLFTGVMAAVMVEFTLHNKLEVTALPALGFILMGAGALPVGLWADRWGTQRVLQIYLLAMAGAAVAVMLAPEVWLLFVALTLLGLAASLYHPAGVAMLSLGVRARSRAMGINGVAGSIGVATGPLLGLLAAWLGVWRAAYGVLAVIALGAAVYMYLTRNRYAFLDATLNPVSDRVSEHTTPSAGSSRRFGWSLPVVCLMVATTLGGVNYRCLMTALPPFLRGEAVPSSDDFRLAVTVFFVLVAGGIGQIVGGWTSERYGARRVYPILLAVMVPMAILLGTLEGWSAAALVAGGVAICLFAQQPVENSLLAEWTSARRRSVSYGTKFTLTFGIGALGGQIAGLIWDKFDSMAPVFFVIAGFATVMGMLSWYAARRRARAEEPMPPQARRRVLEPAGLDV